MRWSKIKNIILLLLVMVNVLLLAMVGIQVLRSQWGERETRRQTAAVLEKSGITFLPEEIPGELKLTGVKIELEPGGEEAAQWLLGGETKSQTLGGRVFYHGPRGSLSVSASGEMEAKLETPLPLEGDDVGQAGRELLSQLGVQVKETGRIAAGERTQVQYIQLWDGVPVSNEEAVLTWGEQGLEELSFRRLSGKQEPLAGGGETLTASTALIRFLGALNQEGYVCSQITDLYAGYAASGSSVVSLTPAWYVETDTWPWKFVIDGSTGAVSVVE